MEDNNNIEKVPYIVFESSMARAERHIKRLVIALVIAILGIVATNIAWLYVWNSYEFVGDESTITVDSDDGGNANYVGNDGDITNGKDSGDDSNESSQKEER